MATSPQKYGNVSIAPDPPTGRPPVSPRPIIDEENPIPDKYEGNIIFNKTIYSKAEFENKIDTNFNELKTEQPSISVEQFFNLYNEVFFDIPKEGENSHATIIQTSTDYFDDYRSPLQDIIDDKDIEIEELTQRMLEAETRLEGLQTEAQEEEAAAAAENAAYIAEYGSDFENNPLLKYGKLKQNLEVMEERGLLGRSLNANQRNLRQAKEKEDGNVNRKTYNQWFAVIEKRAEGDVKVDLKSLIALTKTSIAAGNGWQI